MSPMETPVDLYQTNLRSICGLFDVEPARPDAMIRGRAAMRQLGRLCAAEVELDAMRVCRHPHHIRRDPGDQFFAILQVEGRCLIQQGDQASLLGAGEMCIVDSSRPSEFAYNGGQSRQVSVHLPRAEMIGRFGATFDTWCHLPEATAWFPPIFAVAARLLEAKSATCRKHLEESFLSLLGAALSELDGADVSSAKRETDIVQQAVSIIDQRCADPDFTPARLAETLGVSARTLQRHFQPLGETPGRHLLEARLSEAYRRLTGQCGHAPASVTEVAFASGFSDLSHFHREFKSKYGVTPGDLKQPH